MTIKTLKYENIVNIFTGIYIKSDLEILKKGQSSFTRGRAGVLYCGASKGNEFIETEDSYS